MKRFAVTVILTPIRLFNAVVRLFAAGTHWLQYKAEGVLQGEAEWFDHDLDAYWQWPRRGSGLFIERGVLSSITMRPTDRVLELCSGDGFFTQRFYALRAKEIVAVDANENAVAHARRYHAATNIKYLVGDVLGDLPAGPFDRVVWDAAMHFFNGEQIDQVLSSVAAVLAPSGMISGYTVVGEGADYAFLVAAFSGPAEIADRLAGHFAHVAVLETESDGRRNIYFFASNDLSVIPLSAQHALVETRPRPSTDA
jgi:SAM-dependent methyltransferase